MQETSPTVKVDKRLTRTLIQYEEEGEEEQE